MKRGFLVALCLAVSACSAPVTMRNPTTGQTAQCGPYGFGLAFGGAQLAAREGQCINDFQRQGFERASN